MVVEQADEAGWMLRCKIEDEDEALTGCCPPGPLAVFGPSATDPGRMHVSRV
jgi:hypothetical protein